MGNLTEFENRLLGGSGAFVIADTNAHDDISCASFQVNAEAAIASIKITADQEQGGGESGEALEVLGLAGITLAAGMYFPVGINQRITSITLTSGSLIMHRTPAQ